MNPLQFGPTEDLAAYPRDLAGDAAAAEAEGVDVLFAPPVEEMYPAQAPVRTVVHVDELTAGLCGASRPTHFDGVTTVVAKLFSIVGPCRAYFGRKDAQQLAVVRRMAADLNLPVEVVGCPLVRESDGLAMSSRNAYLTAGDRAAALVLSCALREAVDRIRAGSRDAGAVQAALADRIASEPGVRLDYAEIVDATDLTNCNDPSGSPASSAAPGRDDPHRRRRLRRAGPSHRQRNRHRVNIGRRGRPRRPRQRKRAAVRRIMMKSKIHRATVVAADLNYIGSITLDPLLMELADILEHEQVHVLDIDNGARFETYAIKGGPGDVILNGAAARLVHPGDKVIVITYAEYEEAELDEYAPKVVHVDERNRPTSDEIRALERELRDFTP